MNDLFVCGEDRSVGYTLKAQQSEFDLQTKVYRGGWRWCGGLCLKIQPSGKKKWRQQHTRDFLVSQPSIIGH